MENSKKYMKENGLQTRISFNDGSEHTVKIIKDKVDSIPTSTGLKEGMKYLVEEAGEQKTFFTGSIGLIGKLSECEAGDVVSIQMKKANNKSYFVVKKQGELIGDDGVVADDALPEEQPEW